MKSILCFDNEFPSDADIDNDFSIEYNVRQKYIFNEMI